MAQDERLLYLIFKLLLCVVCLVLGGEYAWTYVVLLHRELRYTVRSGFDLEAAGGHDALHQGTSLVHQDAGRVAQVNSNTIPYVRCANVRDREVNNG